MGSVEIVLIVLLVLALGGVLGRGQLGWDGPVIQVLWAVVLVCAAVFLLRALGAL